MVPDPFFLARQARGPQEKKRGWPRETSFEQYRMASGLAGREEEQQVSTLLYCLGEDAEDILDSTRIAVDDKKEL